jgi:hypothetical protein
VSAVQTLAPRAIKRKVAEQNMALTRNAHMKPASRKEACSTRPRSHNGQTPMGRPLEQHRTRSLSITNRIHRTMTAK